MFLARTRYDTRRKRRRESGHRSPYRRAVAVRPKDPRRDRQHAMRKQGGRRAAFSLRHAVPKEDPIISLRTHLRLEPKMRPVLICSAPAPPPGFGGLLLV